MGFHVVNLQDLRENFALCSALLLTVDLDRSQCVHKAASVAAQTQQLHKHISKGDHIQDPHSTAGLHPAGMAEGVTEGREMTEV